MGLTCCQAMARASNFGTYLAQRAADGRFRPVLTGPQRQSMGRPHRQQAVRTVVNPQLTQGLRTSAAVSATMLGVPPV